MSAWPASEREHRFCGFCGRAEHEAAILMAGPNRIFICDECVDQAGEIIAAKRRKLAEAKNAATSTGEAGGCG